MSATFDARFDDGKDDGALRTIGEVSKALGIKAHVLRYWEQQFPMLKPLKRSGGRRYYRSEDVAMVEDIDRLVNREGYTLKGAQQALKTPRTMAPAPVEPSTQVEKSYRDSHNEQPARSGNDAVSAEVVGKIWSIRSKLAAALEN